MARDMGGQPLGLRLARISGAIRNAYQRQTARQGEDMRLTGLLLTIAGGGDLTQRQCAARMGLDPSTLGRLVDQLEAAGRLTRTAHAADRRAHVLALTETGRQEAAEARAAIARIETALLDRLTPEDRAALHTGLTALTRALDLDP